MGQPNTYVTPARHTHFEKGRKGLRPVCIILHATAGTDSLGWLRAASSPPVSAHALITKEGKIFHIVKDEDTAWHAGFGWHPNLASKGSVTLNHLSLGLELENRNDGLDIYPAQQLKAAAWWISTKWGRWGYLPVLPHAIVDPTRKTDPEGFPTVTFAELLRVECQDWDLPF